MIKRGRSLARLLVADQDHLMRWSLEQLLTRAGHAVRTVDSDKAAIAAVKADDYRVAIIEHTEAGDFDALHEIKVHSPETHVIVMTAYATAALERLARDSGAFDFLEKPFQLQLLERVVARAIVTPERRKDREPAAVSVSGRGHVTSGG